ncbi:hypothetical protein DB346_01595 [Verrucomicrobia bacterium LW23]|nr:hypothetical protein DB346_01595 [Verrucomicrobia bacterium LW23]
MQAQAGIGLRIGLRLHDFAKNFGINEIAHRVTGAEASVAQRHVKSLTQRAGQNHMASNRKHFGHRKSILLQRVVSRKDFVTISGGSP